MNKVIIGVLAVVLVGGGIYFLTQGNMSDSAKGTMSDEEMQKEAMMKDQMQKDAMAKDALQKDEMEKDKMDAGVMVGGAMMVPNLDIVANAMNASNVSTVVAAVSAAGLVDTLKGPGPFTMFAPNNAAFDALPKGTVDTLLLPENKAKLTSILTYHVVPGRYTAADLNNGQKLKTVNGQEITITKVGSKIMVNGSATVETADVISSNGVTFVIDGVLMPK